MAAEGGGKETNEIKTQFTTREGVYRLLTHSEYSRPNRVPFNSQGSNPVRVSFVNVNDQSGNGDRICFNVGRELYFYIYKGVRKAADLSKPIDKRIYKGTQPTCHDFNPVSATADSVSLLVGFSAGQVQLIDPIKKETSKLFNEERLIDKSRVTCVRWVPGSETLFLVAHSSGSLYLYNVENMCGTTAPHYQLLKQGESYSVHTCKSKTPRNPLLRWTVGEGALNEFAFSPDGKFLACASQDGYLRVFGFDAAELHGTMKSYFGGLLCVCWSPDGRYLVAGGEDDLVTVWSFSDCRVIARGHGHKSWVSVVAFDHCTSSVEEGAELSGSDDDCPEPPSGRDSHCSLAHRNSTDSRPLSVTYRFGSVGQDTQLCLWDLTEDVLFPHLPLSRTRTHTNVMSATCLSSLGQTATVPPSSAPSSTPSAPSSAPSSAPGVNGKDDGSNSSASGNSATSLCNSLPHSTPTGTSPGSNTTTITSTTTTTTTTSTTTTTTTNTTTTKGNSLLDSSFIASGVSKFATLSLHESRKDRHEKEHKRNHSLGNSRSSDKLLTLGSGSRTKPEPAKTLGTTLCPRMEDVPMLEPLVCKKIAHERLTVLIFLEDCLVTGCQEGFICTWARPGKVASDRAVEDTLM
ncbi:WD repeat-containing protein 20 [Periophthalmus magnuspinnatus]|uniref:WD repeat-containing protein 20 n=1 Tax=Periophthalmus magnuspinnatus TaxID=409849 RepID=UPI00145AD0FF|nr:WD repeat-containing protein 20 [Periophthalmus magnuspinnatus]